MNRDSLDSPTTQAFRLRDATRGIYHHAGEQLLRVNQLVQGLPQDDPLRTEWLVLRDLLDRGCTAIREANDLAHVIGSRLAAIRDRDREEAEGGRR